MVCFGFGILVKGVELLSLELSMAGKWKKITVERINEYSGSIVRLMVREGGFPVITLKDKGMEMCLLFV